MPDLEKVHLWEVLAFWAEDLECHQLVVFKALSEYVPYAARCFFD